MSNRILAGGCFVIWLGFIGFSQPLCAEYRSLDGSANNLNITAQGAANTPIIRFQYAAFYPGDGRGTTMLQPPAAPNPRALSNSFAQAFADRVDSRGLLENSRNLSDYIWQWGQFLTHDLDLSTQSAANGVNPIAVPTGDPQFDPLHTGTQIIPFTRSDFVISPATQIREQLNRVTSYIDASQVYGSDATRARALRTLNDGKLLTSAGNLPGFNTGGFLNDNNNPSLTADQLFFTGDVRANEQVGLTALHTVFLREHNRLADLIAARQAASLPADPIARDEEIYQRARRIVGAEMQIITYREFLPALMGQFAPRAESYSYLDFIDASVTQTFSHALFRIGHSQNSPTIQLVNGNGQIIDSLSLRDGFFNPALLRDNPDHVNQILRGLAVQRAQATDLHYVEELRSFLFGPPGAGGLDLLALDIQRGRDHGLPSYNQSLLAYAGDFRATVQQITPDVELQAVLTDLYDIDIDPNNIGNIDLIVGALAEPQFFGELGQSAFIVIDNQFRRLRDGDRFFYLGEAAGLYDNINGEYALRSEIRDLLDLDQLTLSRVIKWNTDIGYLPENVFFAGPVPEPSGLVMIGLSGAGAFWFLRYRKRAGGV
ncbi:MAG: peroxidase family protein [Pirellulales bacterium]|nr:peroxidase family protein [Pirellulales bacterium]